MLTVDEPGTLFRQSYMRGVVIFLYGLGWLVALLAGFLVIDPLFSAETGLASTLLVATWSSALAGGLGGLAAMLNLLYRHVSISQDIQNQSMLRYFIQPLAGVVAGVLSLYLITIPGALILNLVTNLNLFFDTVTFFTIFSSIGTLLSSIFSELNQIVTGSSFISLQILIAWIAGFYQHLGLKGVRSAVHPALGDAKKDQIDLDSPFYYKAWLDQRQQLARWSITWGLFLFLYGIAWFAAFVTVYLWSDQIVLAAEASDHAAVKLVLAALPVAAAGGLGGVVNLFRELYQHVSVAQDFHRQHVMIYLVQPVIGFILGLAMYFLLASGYLAISSLRSNGQAPLVVDSPAYFMAQLVLGWVAGFRQRTIGDIIQRIVAGVVTLAKLVGAYFYPPNLFNKAKRDELAVEIRKKLGLFETLRDENSSSANV